jgi:hypothetical protein
MNRSKSKTKVVMRKEVALSAESKSRGRSNSNAKIPTAMQKGPKGKRSAYAFHNMEVRDDIKSVFTAKYKGEDQFSGKQVTEEVGKRFKNLSEKEFKHYQKLADDDADRLERQTDEWEKKGYWMDGDKKLYPTKKKMASKSKSKSKKKGGKKTDAGSESD